MTKRVLLTPTPFLAVLAIAVLPVSAQAAPHYFSNGLGEGSRIKGGEKVPTIAWGTLSLTNLTTGGKVSCHNVIGAVEENPEPGGAAGPAAQGETQSFDPYECESEACTAAATGGGPATYISVFAEGSEAPSSETGTGTMTSPNTGTTLPTEEPLVASGDDLKWKNHLLSEGTTVRQETEAAKVNVICHVMTGVNAKGEPEYGAQVPEVSKGNDKPKAITKCCTKGIPPELEFDAGSGALENEKCQQGKTEGRLKTIGYNAQELVNAKAEGMEPAIMAGVGARSSQATAIARRAGSRANALDPPAGPVWHVDKGCVEGLLKTGGKGAIALNGVGGIGKGYKIAATLQGNAVTLKCDKETAADPEIQGGEPGKDMVGGLSFSEHCEVEGMAKCVVKEPITTGPLTSELFFANGGVGKNEFVDVFGQGKWATIELESPGVGDCGLGANAITGSYELKGTAAANVTPPKPEPLVNALKLTFPAAAIAKVENAAKNPTNIKLELGGQPATLIGESTIQPNEAGFVALGVFEK